MKLTNDELIEQMSKEAEAIADLIKATERLLNAKTKSNEPGNVIFVDFAIAREFEKVKATPMKLSQVLSVYHDWAFRTYKLVKQNKNNLKNKRVLEMIQLNLSIVNTITTVLSTQNNE